ncbi:helix-turn-helix domain-containing protein [Sulfitobacter sp. MF3-043]|uniref:helix-turn-helix domain-containing protein n=1 Tax=Sulfitobacter sediminivivens TaxID=3252902 RepID=UPI0036D8AA6C
MPADLEIGERLAARLKEERKKKGLSLEALARLSGVSRSMLSQIERSESSPTVASLWNLTRALNVDFAGLLDESADAPRSIKEVVRANEIPQINSKAGGCIIRILSAPEDVGQTEVYDIEFKDNALLDSAPHKANCEEHLTVLAGTVLVRSDEETALAEVGDTLRYRADRDHSIQAKGNARVILIVKNA